MPDTAAAPRTSIVQSTLARDRLGVPAIVYFVVSAAAPLTVTAASIPAAWATTKIVGLPLAILVTAVPLALFAVGYTAMSKHIVNAGAFYAYLSRGLGRIPGVAGALVALVAYCSLQISLYGGLGVVAAGFGNQYFGWTAPWWVYSLVAWAIVAACGLARITVNAKVLAVLLGAELVVIVIFCLAMAGRLSSEANLHVGWAGLSGTAATSAGITALVVGSVVAVSDYTGFEDSANYSEESRNPRRTVRVATYVALGTMAIVYTLTTWLMSAVAGSGQIVAVAGKQGTELIFALSRPGLPGWLGWLVVAGHILLMTSLLACAIAFHNTLGRYAFALGRERVLPKAFGYTWSRTLSPAVASLTQTGLALLAIAVVAFTGADPLVKLGFWLGSLAGLGVMVLMAATCIAVIGYFYRDPAARAQESVWSTAIAPALGAVLLVFMVIVTVANYAKVLGVQPGDPLVTWFLSVYAVAVVLGVVRGLWMRFRRPETYAGIGYGADASARHQRPVDTPA